MIESHKQTKPQKGTNQIKESQSTLILFTNFKHGPSFKASIDSSSFLISQIEMGKEGFSLGYF